MKNFTTSNQVENTLKQVGISLSRSTFRRCIEKVYNNTDYTQEQEGQISLPENPRMCTSEKKNLWTDETKKNLHLNDGREKYEEAQKQLNHTASNVMEIILQHMPVWLSVEPGH